MSSRPSVFWRSGPRRAISLVVVLGMFCAYVPFKTHADAVEKKGSRPFPCQHRACGCRSADQCWKQCCCFSHSEKLAWAEANGVTPPNNVKGRREVSAAAKSCHSNSTGRCQKTRTVAAFAAAGCQGQFWHWSAIPVSIPQPAAARPQVAAFGGYHEGVDQQFDALGAVRPPVPPPRA